MMTDELAKYNLAPCDDLMADIFVWKILLYGFSRGPNDQLWS